MITTTDHKKCRKYNIDIFNDKLTCEYYKLDLNIGTTIIRNGCWNCYYYK